MLWPNKKRVYKNTYISGYFYSQLYLSVYNCIYCYSNSYADEQINCLMRKDEDEKDIDDEDDD